jgi:FHS family L-fucose permease-like MFS transporter
MNTTTNQKSNRIVPIIMMIALFGMISFVTNLAAPMGQVLKEQFGASNFQGLLGNMANFIAYAVMGIPGGILLQRVGYKKTALIAIAIGFLGVFIQFLSGHASHTSAFGVYLLGAFVAGFSMCLLNTVVNPMLNTLGGGGNKGNQLIQVGGSFNSVMATFTPAFVGILIGEAAKANIKDVFPVMYIAMGVFALVFFVMLIVNIPCTQRHIAGEDSVESCNFSAPFDDLAAHPEDIFCPPFLGQILLIEAEFRTFVQIDGVSPYLISSI